MYFAFLPTTGHDCQTRYETVLTRSQQPTGSQLNLPHGAITEKNYEHPDEVQGTVVRKKDKANYILQDKYVMQNNHSC